MSTNATGTPTSLGIPKFDVNNDAPNGLGVNEMMDALDTLIGARILKSLGTTAGDLIYWTGASTPARRAVGNTGDILTVSGGLPVWAAPSAGIPAGVIFVWSNTTEPTGYFLLNGQTITNAQSLYPNLWANASTGWRSGSNLILPDARGRVVAGLATSGTLGTFSTTAGAETHTLSTGEMPVHNHGVTDPGHTHSLPSVTGTGGFGNPFHTADGNNTFATTGSGSTGITIQNAGSGNAHNNIQPTLVLNYIIKN